MNHDYCTNILSIQQIVRAGTETHDTEDKTASTCAAAFYITELKQGQQSTFNN